MMAPAGSAAGWALLAVMTLIALALGAHLVLAIGGGAVIAGNGIKKVLGK